MSHLTFNAIVVAIAASVCSPNLSAQCTGTPGGTTIPAGSLIANTTWCPANSPYHVQGIITVGGLTIEAGTEILMDPGAEIDVALTITALGTWAEPIVFDWWIPGSGNEWNGLRFHNAPPGSILRHCIIRHSKSSGVEIINSLPLFEDCLIEENTNFGGTLCGGGIDATLILGDLVLRRCQIVGNQSRDHGGGIRAGMAAGCLKLDGCTIEGNYANPSVYGDSDVVGGGLWLHGDGSGLFTDTTFQNNTVRTCAPNSTTGKARGGAVFIGGDLDVTMTNCVIRANLAKSTDCGSWNSWYAYGGGIAFYGTHLMITNSVIAGNTLSSGHGSYGAGLFSETSGVVEIVNSTIAWNNTHGLYNNGGTMTLLNSILYFNYSSGAQIAGTVAQDYCDIQNGTQTGTNGNIDITPFFPSGSAYADTVPALKIVYGSPCMDAGDPSTLHDDQCFPPSLGDAANNIRNDMGAHGGPDACGWGASCEPYRFCPRSPTSLDPVGARIDFSGTTSYAANDFGLVASPVIPNQPGIFFYGPKKLKPPTPFGEGLRCVSGGIFRLNPVAWADGVGVLSCAVDNTTLAASGQFFPGNTWFFQAWFRDPPTATGFNLSDALAVTFMP